MNLLFLPAITTATFAGIALSSGRGPGAILLASSGAWLALAIGIFAAALTALTGMSFDGLSIGLALLTLFVGAIVLTFSTRYLRADANAQSYAVKVLLLLSAILIFVVADNIFLFVLGWLVSGWLLAALIGHLWNWDEARIASFRTIGHFAIGDLALVAAATMLALDTGSTNIGTMIAAVSEEPGSLTVVAALLLVIAAMARCALPPFSRWLTLSMTAPTPVSALMHAGFVNAGGFLLIRFGPVLEQAPIAQSLAIGAGVIAALWGIGIMLVRPDIKRSLAGSTIAQMGFMLMTCGLGAYAAALWHLIAHGLFKAWLFLESGSAIGAGYRGSAPLPGPAVLAGTACLTVLAGIVMIGVGVPTAALVPIILALMTGLATLLGLRRAPMLALPLIGVVILYVCGLWLAEAVLDRPYGDSPSGRILAFGLVMLFAGVWIAHSALARSGRGLPPKLYCRLLAA